MNVPAQKPGRSKQDYGTPLALIQACEARFGSFSLDLAASEENKKAPRCITIEHDSLTQDWTTLAAGGLCWLNPPFSDIGVWTAKCRAEADRGCRIVMLVPASIGSEWFARDVFDHAAIIAIRPRLTFEGCTDPYPKDCMLLLWGMGGKSVMEIWRWKL